MTFSKKNIVLTVIGLIGAYILYSFLNTFFLIKNFKDNIKDEDFVPTAFEVEVGQNDENAKRVWKIKAKAGKSNSGLTEIEADDVTAIIYDDNEQPRLEVFSTHATFSNDNSNCVLNNNIEVKVINKDLIIKTDQLVLQRNEPIEFNGNVEFIDLAQPGRKLYANKALIDKGINMMTLYEITRSPIAPGSYLSGGQTSFNLFEEMPNVLNVTNGAKVENEDITASGGQLIVYLVNGQPSSAILKGRPHALQNGKRLYADRIEYDFPSGKIKAIGNIHTN